MSPVHQESPIEKQPVAANSNDGMPKGITLTFDELVQKSGIDEDTLLQRIAGVLSRRPDAEG